MCVEDDTHDKYRCRVAFVVGMRLRLVAFIQLLCVDHLWER